MRDAIFRLTLGIYYLALGTWVGATGMMAIAAGLTFVTLRQADPVLPGGPAGNADLAPFTADFLAGNAVNPAFTGLTFIHAACALALLACIVVHVMLKRDGRGSWLNLLRLALIGGALLLFLADGQFTRNTMNQLRDQMYQPQVTAAQFTDFQDQFQGLHQRSARAQLGMVGLLAAAALVSPFVFRDDRRDSTENPPHG